MDADAFAAAQRAGAVVELVRITGHTRHRRVP
jgi:hypothetical protein